MHALSAPSHKSPLTPVTLDCYHSHSNEAISGDVVIALFQSRLSLNACPSTVCPSFRACLCDKASDSLPGAITSKYHYRRVCYVLLMTITPGLQKVRCCISLIPFQFNTEHRCMYFFFFPMALRPNAGHGLLILEVSRSHTTTHHSR